VYVGAPYAFNKTIITYQKKKSYTFILKKKYKNKKRKKGKWMMLAMVVVWPPPDQLEGVAEPPYGLGGGLAAPD
jgi:hypothetical protein